MFFIKDKKGESIHGPYAPKQIRHWLRNRHINLFTPARKEEDEEWKMVGSFVELSLRMDEEGGGNSGSDAVELLELPPFAQKRLESVHHQDGGQNEAEFSEENLSTEVSEPDITYEGEMSDEGEGFPEESSFSREPENVIDEADISEEYLGQEVVTEVIPQSPVLPKQWFPPVPMPVNVVPSIPSSPPLMKQASSVDVHGQFVKKHVEPIGRYGQYRGIGSVKVEDGYLHIEGRHVYLLAIRLTILLGVSFLVGFVSSGLLTILAIPLYFAVEYLFLKREIVKISLGAVTKIALDAGRELVAVEFSADKNVSPVVIRTGEWRELAAALYPPGSDIDAIAFKQTEKPRRMRIPPTPLAIYLAIMATMLFFRAHIPYAVVNEEDVRRAEAAIRENAFIIKKEDGGIVQVKDTELEALEARIQQNIATAQSMVDSGQMTPGRMQGFDEAIQQDMATLQSMKDGMDQKQMLMQNYQSKLKEKWGLSASGIGDAIGAGLAILFFGTGFAYLLWLIFRRSPVAATIGLYLTLIVLLVNSAQRYIDFFTYETVKLLLQVSGL